METKKSEKRTDQQLGPMFFNQNGFRLVVYLCPPRTEDCAHKGAYDIALNIADQLIEEVSIRPIKGGINE